MKISSKHFFKKLLDADTAEHLLDPENFINSQNIRFGTSEDGKVGYFESVPGTLSLTSGGIVPANSKTIGGGKSEDGRYIVWFNYNSDGNHNIVFYDLKTEQTLLLMEDADVDGGLGFSADSRINYAAVVNGMIYWRDRQTDPRCIHIGAMLKAKNPSYDGELYDDFSYASASAYEDITIIKRPPNLPLSIAKDTVISFTNNFIATESWKFSWRYLLYTGEKTVFAPWSEASFLNTDTDDRNTILITPSINNPIPVMVKVVEVVAWVGSSNTGYVIQSWDKSNPSDAAAIAAHNIGVSALQFHFYGQPSGSAISLDELLRPFDLVPLSPGALEIGKDRLFMVDGTFGYDTPSQSSLSVTLSAPHTMTSADSGTQAFRPRSSRQAGIVFYDRFMRKCGTFTSNYLNIAIPARDFDFTNAYRTMQWDLSLASAADEIPEMAHYYAPVLTRDLGANWFISGADNNTRYATKDSDGLYVFTATTFEDGETVALALNSKQLIGEGLGYTFSEGDIAILTPFGGGATVELPVIGTADGYILLKAYDFGTVGFFPTLYQIYSPHKKSEDEPFYEVGQVYPITNPGTISRTYSTTTGTFAGDAFIIARNYTLDVTLYSESMSPNDLYFDRWDTNASRINLVTAVGQVRRESTIVWSNVFIQGTSVNGLSTFEYQNQKDLPVELGAVTGLRLTAKVQEQGTVMLAIGSGGETASIYLGEQELFGADGTRQLIRVNDVIGQVTVLKGSYGSINPESIAIDPRGLVFWFDAFSNSFIQYGVDGLNAVSDYQIRKATRKFSLAYLSLTSGSPSEATGYVVGGYDPFNQEYLASVPRTVDDADLNYLLDVPWVDPDSPPLASEFLPYPYDFYDGRPKSWVFKPNLNRWQGSFKFSAEFMITVGEQLFSFKAGVMYLHGAGENNTFYSEYAASKWAFVCNGAGGDVGISKIKRWLGIASESSHTPTFVHARTETPNVQSTDLSVTSGQSDFSNRQGVFYAGWRCDRLSPNVTGTSDEKLYTGDFIYGPWLKVYMEFDTQSERLEIKFVNIAYKRSLGHANI